MKRFIGLALRPGSVWAAVCLAGLITGHAQQPASTSAGPNDRPLKQLSLAHAQLIAFEKNWDLLAAAAGVDAATAQKIVAHEFPNPTLSLYSSLINVDNHPSGTSEGNGIWERSYDTIFAINQLFEIGGKRRNRKASAQAGFEGAKAQLLDARRTLDVAVAKAYVAAAQAEENVRVLSQSAGKLREEARIAEVRLRAGEISSSDKSQIEITAEQFELNAQSAKSAAAQARVTLEVLLGVPNPNADCLLTDHLETLCAATTPINTNSVGTWRPDVMAAEAALRKAEADLRFQKALRVPDPTLQAQYEHQPPDNPNSVGFMVSLPVPLWNRNRGNILAAEAAREQARLAFEKTKAEAMGDIAVARLAYEDALKRWRSYRESIRPKSEQIRQTKAYAYQKGGTSLLDLLVAERNDNDIRLAAAQAASDTASAGAAFKAATQEIQPTQVKQ
jgi:cobalt-zinc-cadmium efflux system outer membrane protein